MFVLSRRILYVELWGTAFTFLHSPAEPVFWSLFWQGLVGAARHGVSRQIMFVGTSVEPLDPPRDFGPLVLSGF